MVTLSDANLADRYEALVALRSALAAEIDGCPASQTAALARQFREVLKEIAELDLAKPKGSKVDDLAARRKARLAATPGAVTASGDHG